MLVMTETMTVTTATMTEMAMTAMPRTAGQDRPRGAPPPWTDGMGGSPA
jgi:hypothetical protein